MTVTIQLFNDKPETIKSYNSFKPLFNYLSAESKKLKDNAYLNEALGEVIYNLDLIPLASAIQKDFFVKVFSTIISSLQHIGNFESYISIMRALFGAEAEVTFTRPAPAHLQINIASVSDVVLSRWVDDLGNYITTENPEIYINFANLLENIDSRGLQQVLYYCVPPNIYVEFTIE